MFLIFQNIILKYKIHSFLFSFQFLMNIMSLSRLVVGKLLSQQFLSFFLLFLFLLELPALHLKDGTDLV